MYFVEDAGNNSLVVFIHGVFGDASGSWKDLPVLLQHEPSPSIRSYDMYLFRYDSSLRHQPALNTTVVDSLDTFLRGTRGKYQTTVLIGHSQGGIVAKLYVLRYLREARGLDLTVDLMITLGTPHRGKILAGCALPLRQVRQLAPWSQNIRTLKREWGPPYIPRAPCPPEQSVRYIRSLAVDGAYDWVVSAKSARGFSVDIGTSAPASHSALPKPASSFQPLAEWLIYELSEHKYPQAIVEDTRRIRSDPAERALYRKDKAALIAPLVAQQRLGMNLRQRSEMTASILMNFLYDFEARPLRCLTFDEALVCFARRHLGLI